jgi:ATP-dependent Clp protease, protease subunit
MNNGILTPLRAGARMPAAAAAPRGRAPVNNASARANGQAETIFLYDVIGGDDFFGGGISAKGFVEQLQQLGGAPLNIRINSPGGDVFDGLAMFNALVRYPAAVNVFIDGMAWSIAGVIAMAGDTVAIAANAMFMIHDPAVLMLGTADELRVMADNLDTTKENLIDAYQRQTNAGREKLADWMTAETWFSAEETVAAGFAQQIDEPLQVAAAYPRAFRFRNMPSEVARRAAARPARSNADRRIAALATMRKTVLERGGRSL